MASKRSGPRGEDGGELADVFKLKKTVADRWRGFDVLGGPSDTIGHVDAGTAEREDGKNVGLEGISDHQKTLRIDGVSAKNGRIGSGVFFG
jgi:hypothetical protein